MVLNSIGEMGTDSETGRSVRRDGGAAASRRAGAGHFHRLAWSVCAPGATAELGVELGDDPKLGLWPGRDRLRPSCLHARPAPIAGHLQSRRTRVELVPLL